MADSKITQLPQGLFNQQTILPIVSDGVTSQATFNTLVNSLGPYFSGSNDTVVTGGTYSNGTTLFRNNTGGTFNVSGFSTGNTFSQGTINRLPLFISGNTLGDSAFAQTGGNIGLGSVNIPGELFHIGDGNMLLEGGGEVAQKFKRDFSTTGENSGVQTGSGISTNPIFQIGRIIQAGDGDPEIRIMYSDDVAYERTVFEIDRKGIVASVKTQIGSHFEGFASLTDENPMFRLNSYPNMRLEMGLGGFNITDVAVERDIFSGLSFYTNSTKQASISNIGNLSVGGVDDTVNKLQIYGNTRLYGDLSANTISATTYLNLPTDIRVTGGTYTAGTATFRNNTGGTFNVTGFSTVSNITSGTFTPILVNGTNVSSSSTDRLGTWTKIGNIVTLKFDFLVQPISASTNTSLTATIPFNINSGEGTQYIGSVVGSVAPYSTGFVQGNTSSATVQFYPTTTANSRWVASVSYISN